MTSETDNKVEAAVERARALLRGDFGAWDDDYVLDVLKGVISDRDRLAGEVVALSQVAVGPLSYTAMRAAKEAAEAKLSALVETLTNAVKEVEAARTNEAICFAYDGLLIAARQALASLDRTAPAEPAPGEVRVIDGKRMRFVEHDDRGQVWEVLPVAPESEEQAARKAAITDGDRAWALETASSLAGNPEFLNSAPAQEVAGLVETLQAMHDQSLDGRTHDVWDRGRRAGLGEAINIVKQFALSSSPSQGGETVERSGVAAADNNHKALVAMLTEAARRLRLTDDGADEEFASAITIKIAAFQSRKEESR